MAASGKRQAPGEDSLGTNEVDDVRRAVKRLRTGDEPLPVGLPVLDAGLQLQALNAPPAPLASAQPVAPTQQPVKEQHAAPQWSMRGSQQSLDDVSPTRPPLPECEESEEAEEGCRDYSEMNLLLRSLHFERLARLASPPPTQKEPPGSSRRAAG